MSRKRRTFSTEEKLAILAEVERDGLSVTLRKHGLYAKTISHWRKRFEEDGSEPATESDPAARMELRRLRQENQQLKELVAEKELELRIKESLLKKTRSRERTD